MSQRYFLTTESTYEALRLAVDGDLGYPTATASSIFTPALQAPRDSLRRIVLAVDTSLPGYVEIDARVTPLLANSSAQELTEAEYLAFLACVPTTTDAISFTQVSDTTTYTNFLPEGGSLATALSGIDSALDGKAATSHAHAWSDITSGVPSTFTPPEMSDAVRGGAKLGGGVWVSGGRLQANFRSDDAGLGNEYSNYQYKDVVLYNAKLYQCTATGGASGGPGEGPTASKWTQVVTASDIGAASQSHAHGAITSDGKIGSTSGQIVVTTTAGALTTAGSIGWSQVSSTPTTRSGYGITDAQKTITSGTAAPTGGSDGDIYLQYT